MKRASSFLGLAAPALLAFASGCGGAGPYSRDGGVQRLATRAVDWNPTHADVGRVAAVADRGTDVVVFADGAATVMESGAVSLVDRSVPKWTSAATIPAADGGVPWIVGLDDHGHVHRLRARTGFEDVSGRWGLENAHVLGAVGLGDRGAAFLFDGGMAVASGNGKVVRLGGVPISMVAGGGGAFAGVSSGDVVRVDPSSFATKSFALGGAIATAVDEAGHLYAATPDAVYAENDKGELALRFKATLGAIHGLVASKGRVWFAEGPELGAIEGATVVATTGAKLPPGGRLFASTTGDVWIVDGGVLTRFARDAGVAGPGPSPGTTAPGTPPSTLSPDDSWRAQIQPVFARACASCHLPNGPAGIDLSTSAAWIKRKADVKERVLDTKDMPPKGHPLGEADMAAIRAWIAR
jgi:Cytochrome C oxidase, cbb3-type, subunit III